MCGRAVRPGPQQPSGDYQGGQLRGTGEAVSQSARLPMGGKLPEISAAVGRSSSLEAAPDPRRRLLILGSIQDKAVGSQKAVLAFFCPETPGGSMNRSPAGSSSLEINQDSQLRGTGEDVSQSARRPMGGKLPEISAAVGRSSSLEAAPAIS